MNERPGKFLLIGLHKLAAERGDGLVPELLALYGGEDGEPDVVPAPRVVAAAKGVSTRRPSTIGASNDNVIVLAPYLLARRNK